ncbi:MAG: cysteine hydrolase [Acidobacteria bacterium]|nr:cysteine hydrolase [Acidobacteriota bacterium]
MRLDPKKTAAVCIDLHRGHLDMTVATVPLPAERAARVIRDTAPFLRRLRALALPVIHVVSQYRSREEIASNPFWQAIHDDPTKARRGILQHNLRGRPGTQVIPELWDERDILVDTKKRYSSYLGTDLEFVLRSRGIDTVILCGVNTNTCVLCAAFESTNRDFRVILAEEGVDTMDGEAMHRFALQSIGASLGWVMRTAEILQALQTEGQQ